MSLCFFDLEKAYDTAGRYGIIRDLQTVGVRGRLLRCIIDFLEGRTFRVQLGTILSRMFVQENGVPQGSVLSVTLFILKMNSISKEIPPSISYSLYVDDVQISYSSSNLNTCERQIQLTINKLHKWANENGFKFSPEKTVCVLFSRIRGMFPEPSLQLDGHDLVVQSNHKFLGLTFDKKLSFQTHIQCLKVKCLKSLNLLKILSHRSWGADKETLLRVYTTTVRSKLDYGCMVYGSARKSVLKRLDPIHHQGLRLVLGAFRTSPVESLYVECNEWSLKRRRFYLSTLYGLRVRSYSQHPALPSVKGTRFKQLFLNKPTVTRPFSLRILDDVEFHDFTHYNSPLVESSNRIPPWQQPPKCDLSLTRYNKRDTPSTVLQQEFSCLKESFGNHVAIYTDGSKTETGVSCAMVTEACTRSHRLNKIMSIFSAEVYAVILALNYILKHNITYAVIYTDSLSCIQALCGLYPSKNLLVQRARYIASSITNRHYNMTICWVPSHVGIHGNEQADRAAAAALSTDITPFDIPSQDLRTVLKRTINTKWQDFWNEQVHNKLHVVKPNLGKSPHYLLDRLQDVLRCRMRIGHTHLTHGYLLRGNDQPQCAHCGVEISITHILITCSLHEDHRQRLFPCFYRKFLPMHPAFLLGDEPLVTFQKVYEFLRDIGYLRDI